MSKPLRRDEMNRKRNRLQYKKDDLSSFILMHVIFFIVQLFFFYIYFVPTRFTEWNIPVIYFRIQQIGAPTVLVCSLIWMNHTFFPGEAKYLVISIALYIVEWLGIDRLLVHA
jgi:hypothetical protein